MNVNAFSLRFLLVALVHPPIVCVGFIHDVGVFPTGTDLIDYRKEKKEKGIRRGRWGTFCDDVCYVRCIVSTSKALTD